jgi:hypothetical protein
MKARNLIILGAVALLLSATAFVTPIARSAPLAQAGDDGTPMSSPTITQTAADEVAAYWTPARMASAVPLDMGITSDSQQGQVPSEAAPTGPAGAVEGNQAGMAPASGIAPISFGVDDPSPAVWNYYAYPYPYSSTYIGAGWPALYPFETNGKLFFTQYGSNYVCSGTSTTSGGGGNRRIVWTAGHCVHAGNGLGTGWSYNLLFCPAYNNGANAWAGCWSGLESWTWSDWYWNGNLRTDQGVILTSDWSTTGRGRLGDTVGTQGLAWNQPRVQDFWEFGYPSAAPFDGRWQVMVTSSTARDDGAGGAGPEPLGVGSNMTPGASGGGWIIAARLGNWGYLNGVHSYYYPAAPHAMYSPYFGDVTVSLWNATRLRLP